MLHDGCSTGPPPTPPPTADYHVTSNTTNTSSPVTQTFPRFHPEASAGAPAPSSCALAMRGCIVKCVNSQAPADMGIDARHVTAAQCGFVVVLSDRPRTVQEKRAREQSRSHSTCRMSCTRRARQSYSGACVSEGDAAASIRASIASSSWTFSAIWALITGSYCWPWPASVIVSRKSRRSSISRATRLNSSCPSRGREGQGRRRCGQQR